ncbi:MAG: hypothetical protein A3B74_03815 [Candidatus Kerfeldbacteria bacterium RIFCSPHIGHO2_02_FULL_42_14]|uniref:CARDB domain-containing protein n=1 Tax=Candidatus Kerfeldbacteria bacterium RIFCSPHIGHO2_02_FULL_42_14 TaxID=1798540 RepID=A0A1G2AR52_9BACT|nr:MAG: hypothetical protein A3B74_03815 [Candidatus Kerfeldbacteria bacterium RIFCSPHIGHO2_02_FULL_42_14]OGY80640.1 MAG: hypothetical protein A3E60_04315 [Candidatus Kerfeldbacteria bacterium RIFCSPHIGHO2_12_FULL_42_13]OGY82564.1 MAG: hypothetical protein A3I91_03975 [Candidatus Kerfeldbacteria bacterium RIFCSPLOWO2_02_FULL_42_19]OGY85168.1 MAG: hypothetical protein A3G01_01105 [Candidatus Kerfeldbacteria bacterium RIFCSPLOWO2_12_FULL_43_9]
MYGRESFKRNLQKIFAFLAIFVFLFLSSNQVTLSAERAPTQNIAEEVSYEQPKYDVSVENLTAIPSKLEVDGLVLLNIEGKIVNRGTEAVVVKPTQLKLFPDMKEATITFLQNAGKINEEIADILKQYSKQAGFSCNEESEATNCILNPGEEKKFSFNQPSLFYKTTGAVASVIMNKTFSKTDGSSATDENTTNNLKYVILFAPVTAPEPNQDQQQPSNPPDIATQGLTAIPQLDEDSQLTGLEITGYVINLSQSTLVRDFANLEVKVNNKVQSGLDIEFDYSDAVSAWKDEALEALNDYPTAKAALEALFARLGTTDTLYPAGGKAFFQFTLPKNLIKNSNIIAVTAPSGYKILNLPVLDSNGDGQIRSGEINAFINALGSLEWQNGTDANTKNNKAFTFVMLDKKELTVEAGEYLGTLWAIIAGLLDQYNWEPGTLLPDGWTPGTNIPDDWTPGEYLPKFCVKSSQMGTYCPELPDDWAPGTVVSMLKNIAANYDVVYIKGTLSAKISKALKNVQKFLQQKAALPELLSNGIVQVKTKAMEVPDENAINSLQYQYQYHMAVWNPSKNATSNFTITLNIKGEKEITKTIETLKARGMKQLTFAAIDPALTTGGNLLQVQLDSDHVIKERNEWNNEIFKEVVVNEDGLVLLPPRRYVHEESKFLNSFYYIAYPFVRDTELYSKTRELKKVPVQSWILNLLDPKDTGEFQLRVGLAKKDGGLIQICASNESDATNFGTDEWERYQTVAFEFDSCKLEDYRGRPMVFELRRRANESSDFTRVTRRVILVP